jgi:PAS domain-containing protein
MKGLLVDVHGTLLLSNRAWARAFGRYDPDRFGMYCEEISKKRDRRELAAIAKVPYERIVDAYREELTPRQDVIRMIERSGLPRVIVSNARRERLLLDLELLDFACDRIYTKEDGRKPDTNYLERILRDQRWDCAYLIGNDPIEDYSMHPRIQSIIIPQPPCLNSGVSMRKS